MAGQPLANALRSVAGPGSYGLSLRASGNGRRLCLGPRQGRKGLALAAAAPRLPKTALQAPRLAPGPLYGSASVSPNT